MPMDETNTSLFHRLWTKAVGTEGYVKSEWQELEKLLRASNSPALKIELSINDEAVRKLLNILLDWHKILVDSGVKFKESLVDTEIARAWVNRRLAHPAIPEEVRERVRTRMLDWYYSGTKLLEVDGTVADIIALVQVAKCPTATDKAVCPKCGSTATVIETSGNTASCLDCGASFTIQRIIISPSREPKETP